MSTSIQARKRESIAGLQVACVVGGVLAWLWMRPETRVDALAQAKAQNLAIVIHVALAGAVAMTLVLLATWRDASRARSLGLVATPIGAAIGWGFAGVFASYVLSTIAVGIYFAVSWFVSTIRSASTHLALAAHAALAPHAADNAGPLLPPTDGVVGRELANKAEWASELARIPLGWALGIAVFAGVYEEILFRGFVLGRLRVVFGRLAPRARDALAVLVSAALFALGHGYQGGLGLAQTFAAGVVLAALTVWRGTLWSAIVAHVAIDAFGLVALHAIHPLLEKLQHAR
jgi:membrane protease YdiL (CAAX protease family)